MNIAFRTGALGLSGYQKGMDTLANNIANVNNHGYKTMRSSFSDLLYNDMTHYAQKNGKDIRTGLGVKQIATDYMFEQGAPQTTDRDLDFCIIGSGFFQIISGDKKDKSVKYTRDGNFSLKLEKDGAYLVHSASQKYVADKKGQKIKVNMNSDGTVDTAQILKNLGIYKFDNPYAMDPDGSNLLSDNVLTGKPQADNISEVKSGMLEGSTVDVSRQMSDIIITQRSFQFNSRVVQIADEMEQEVNKLR